MGYPTSMAPPLAGRRLLVPPSRLGPNPLIAMLERQGAQVVAFPSLAAETPDLAPLEEAMDALPGCDWLVVAGERSAENLLARLRAREGSLAALPSRIAAIGHGAMVTLRRAGVSVTVTPRDHFASGVADALGDVAGESILLLRSVGASQALPDLLRARGARVFAVAGHGVRPRVTPDEAREAFSRPLDALALANPATVSLLVEALGSLGVTPERCLGGVVVGAVGPATAEAAERLGLPPDLVAAGRLKRLQEALVALLGAPGDQGEHA